jgi:hypothetical protein
MTNSEPNVPSTQDELVGIPCTTLNSNDTLRRLALDAMATTTSPDMALRQWCALLRWELANMNSSDLDDAALVLGVSLVLNDAAWVSAADWLTAVNR